MNSSAEPTRPSPLNPSFKQQMLKSREDAIVATVNRLLAEKGFDAMTVDEVAASVGIAKANLFQHFPTKEALATAAMVRVMGRALDFLRQLPAADAPVDKLKAFAGWAMALQLEGEMPLVPSQNSTLRSTLLTSADYSAALDDVSDALLGWITAAQSAGTLGSALPPTVVLYTLYASACHPVVDYLRANGDYSGDEIVAFGVAATFDGLLAR